jgi:transposase-like protein
VRRGWSAQQLADASGWSSQFIRDRLRQAGIPLRRAGGQAGGADLSPGELQDMLAAGESVTKIAQRSGRSTSGVYKLIRQHGLKVPARQTATRGAGGVHAGVDAGVDTVAKSCAQLYRDGCSLVEVGRRHGHGPDWARARITAAGVEVRTAAQARGQTSSQLRVQADVHELRAAITRGASVPELAEQWGCSQWLIRKWLAEAGLSPPAPRRRQRQLPLLDAATLRELYVHRRMVLTEVAEELGVSVDRVKVGLDAAGIARRPRRPRHVDGPPVAPLTAAQLHDRYVRRGLSTAEVAAEFGTTANRVRLALHQHDIALRDRPRQRVPPLAVDAATLRRLYVDERLDDAVIAERFAVPTDRVRRRRRELGVYRPASAPPHQSPPMAPSPRTLRRLYLEQGVTLVQIARRFHTSQKVVRGWLEQVNVPVRERTSRVHRHRLDLDTVVHLYVEREWPAAAVAAELDTTIDQVLRALHDHRVPVRRGGSAPSISPHRRGGGVADEDGSTALIQALYADPAVQAWLDRHHVPARPNAGPIAVRFPRPVLLYKLMLTHAYEQIGLSARQIELLTGQPAEQILDALHGHGIPVRGSGLSPWMQRRRD